jgi:Zn-dependent protease with chaperone function
MSNSKFLDYLFLTFPMRRVLLIMGFVVSIIPLRYVYMLPISVRIPYAYVITSVIFFALFFTFGKFSEIAVYTVGEVVFGKKYKKNPHHDPSWEGLVIKMGIEKHVEFFISMNPNLRSAFTNPFAKKIYFPESWLSFSEQEQLGIIGHELEHLKSFRKFFALLIVASVLVYAVSFFLSYNTATVFVIISAVSLDLLLITFIARRNELHADYESALTVGPEGLISVFEWMKSQDRKDRGSETHPSFSTRISRLYKLMDEEEGKDEKAD